MREQDLTTPEGWRTAMSRWRIGVIAACVVLAVGVGLGILTDDPSSAFGTAPVALMMAFRAGQLKAEHDRLEGSTRGLNRLRPPGL